MKAQIESMEIFLRFLPTDLKSCEAIEKSLQKIPLVKKIVVTPGEAKMVFTGNWDQLVTVQNAAATARLKGALITPGIFTVDCAPDDPVVDTSPGRLPPHIGEIGAQCLPTMAK